MQSAEISANKTAIKYPGEDEAYWRHHIKLYKASGLISKVEYCRANQVNADRFYYWFSKWACSEISSLVPVKVKPAKKSFSSLSSAQRILGSIRLNRGSDLLIHDIDALSLILERFSHHAP